MASSTIWIGFYLFTIILPAESLPQISAPQIRLPNIAFGGRDRGWANSDERRQERFNQDNRLEDTHLISQEIWNLTSSEACHRAYNRAVLATFQYENGDYYCRAKCSRLSHRTQVATCGLLERPEHSTDITKLQIQTSYREARMRYWPDQARDEEMRKSIVAPSATWPIQQLWLVLPPDDVFQIASCLNEVVKPTTVLSTRVTATTQTRTITHSLPPLPAVTETSTSRITKTRVLTSTKTKTIPPVTETLPRATRTLPEITITRRYTLPKETETSTIPVTETLPRATRTLPEITITRRYTLPKETEISTIRTTRTKTFTTRLLSTRHITRVITARETDTQTISRLVEKTKTHTLPAVTITPRTITTATTVSITPARVTLRHITTHFSTITHSTTQLSTRTETEVSTLTTPTTIFHTADPVTSFSIRTELLPQLMLTKTKTLSPQTITKTHRVQAIATTKYRTIQMPVSRHTRTIYPSRCNDIAPVFGFPQELQTTTKLVFRTRTVTRDLQAETQTCFLHLDQQYESPRQKRSTTHCNEATEVKALYYHLQRLERGVTWRPEYKGSQPVSPWFYLLGAPGVSLRLGQELANSANKKAFESKLTDAEARAYAGCVLSLANLTSCPEVCEYVKKTGDSPPDTFVPNTHAERVVESVARLHRRAVKENVTEAPSLKDMASTIESLAVDTLVNSSKDLSGKIDNFTEATGNLTKSVGKTLWNQVLGVKNGIVDFYESLKRTFLIILWSTIGLLVLICLCCCCVYGRMAWLYMAAWLDQTMLEWRTWAQARRQARLRRQRLIAASVNMVEQWEMQNLNTTQAGASMAGYTMPGTSANPYQPISQETARINQNYINALREALQNSY